MKTYNIRLVDGTSKRMTYDEVCHKLGFIPAVHFVKITNRNTITFTLGKPYEIMCLKTACRVNGFVMAKSLADM